MIEEGGTDKSSVWDVYLVDTGGQDGAIFLVIVVLLRLLLSIVDLGATTRSSPAELSMRILCSES